MIDAIKGWVSGFVVAAKLAFRWRLVPYARKFAGIVSGELAVCDEFRICTLKMLECSSVKLQPSLAKHDLFTNGSRTS